MNAELAKTMRDWGLRAPDGPEFIKIQSELQYLFEELYVEYEPTRGAHPDFWDRMNSWLNNCSDEAAKKTLVRLIPNIFFLGPREMECLHRAAFNHHILSWLMEASNESLSSPDLNSFLGEAVQKTWFCPITDSMRINAFYHYNSIVGRDYRPDWRSLAKFGDVARIEGQIACEGIERIVLLEDFVGSGSQMMHAVRFAGNLPSRLPILVVPLLMSPAADRVVDIIRRRYSNVEVRPVLKLSESTLIRATPHPGEIALAPSVRNLAQAAEAQMTTPLPKDAKWYGPFGFDDSGALVVLHTNCPDNSLPIIHHFSKRWNALFPRSSRI